jgi:hypothetical protein
MSRPRRTGSAVLLAATLVLPVVASGCEVISKVKNVADSVQTLTSLGNKLKDASKLTYTAEYRAVDGERVTLVQQPPKSAYRGPKGAFISTPDGTLLCETAAGKTACQKAPPQSDITVSDAALIPTVTGQGFVPPALAVGLIAAAALQTEAHVEQSTKTIAGQHATCAKATGLSKDGGDKNQPNVQDFSVCITDEGVLGSFDGTLQDGTRASLTLLRYSATADGAAFTPPAGAQITDVGALTP